MPDNIIQIDGRTYVYCEVYCTGPCEDDMGIEYIPYRANEQIDYDTAKLIHSDEELLEEASKIYIKTEQKSDNGNFVKAAERWFTYQASEWLSFDGSDEQPMQPVKLQTRQYP